MNQQSPLTSEEIFDNCELAHSDKGHPFVFVAGRYFTRLEWWGTWEAEYEMRGITKPDAMDHFARAWKRWEVQLLWRLHARK